MGMNETPSGERIRIGFFGRRNAGKSSVVNRFAGQDLAVVSDVAGTTTDPVRKAMELLPLGPVLLIDTPGFDDEGALGAQRVERTRRILDEVDVAVLVFDAAVGLTEVDEGLRELFFRRAVPCVLVANKTDVVSADAPRVDGALFVSALSGEGVQELKETVARMAPAAEAPIPLIADLVRPGDAVILVTPIDSSAPKGRIILPQQQVIRALLDAGAMPLVCQPAQLQALLDSLAGDPALVVTDSQAFAEVARIVPERVKLTSFSILFARYKGDLAVEVAGAHALSCLRDGDRVLIAEGCTHHRQCDDIGAVKIPRLIRSWSGVEPAFEWCSGREFPDDVSDYAVVVHCGGCMLGRREMLSRIARSAAQDVPFVNYGVAIAKMKGILPRALVPFDN